MEFNRQPIARDGEPELDRGRRAKIQGSFPNEAAALTLLYGLVASGQVCFRKLEGWQDMVTALTTVGPKAEEAA